jgi:hypothetical protein
MLHRAESGNLHLTISDATVYDTVSQLSKSGTFASRAGNVFSTVSAAAANLQDVVSSTEDLLDKIGAFTKIAEQISSVCFVTRICLVV